MKNKENKIKEVKKEMENLKKDFDKNYLSLEAKLKKLEKGTYEVGDEVKWCNFDWIVIKTGTKLQNITIDLPGFMVTEENTVTLMLKNTIQNMTYSDINSNDYNESNIKEYLEESFINRLDKSKLLDMRINFDENKYTYTKVRIPTLREIELLPMSIRNCGKAYWTMTSSYTKSEDHSNACVFFVNANGFLNYSWVNSTYGLRPVINLKSDELE